MDFFHYVGEKNDLLLTLGSVLSFITGATNILAVGFSTAPKNCLLSSQYWSISSTWACVKGTRQSVAPEYSGKRKKTSGTPETVSCLECLEWLFQWSLTLSRSAWITLAKQNHKHSKWKLSPKLSNPDSDISLKKEIHQLELVRFRKTTNLQSVGLLETSHTSGPFLQHIHLDVLL